MIKQGHEQDHEHRCRKLQHDGVGGGGQLIGNGEKRGDADHGQGADQHPAAENNPVTGDQQVNTNDGGTDQVAGAVDGQGRPGNKFDKQTTGAEAYRGQKNKEYSAPVLSGFIRFHHPIFRSFHMQGI